MLVSYSSYGWGIYRVWSGAISYGTMTMFLTLTASLTAAVNNVTSIVPSVISLTTSAEDEPLIEELVEDKFQKEYLDELMREVLKDRERQMLRERYGLDNGGMGLSYPQLAPRYNISASRAQQIVENAIHKLANVIRRRGLIDTFRR